MIQFKEHEKSAGSGTGPDLTPLIDMVFLLLVFFLLTSSLITSSVPVELPRSDQGQSSHELKLVVGITETGSLVLNGEPITLKELGSALGRSKARELFIQADQGVRFQRVIDVMDIARHSGIEKTSFLVEKRE